MLKLHAVRRRLVQLALVFLLGFWLCGPVLENERLWDIFPEKDIFPDGGDSVVLIMTAVVTCIGAVMCLAHLILRFFRLRRRAYSPALLSYHRAEVASVLFPDFVLESSPPPLRI